jgi:outer membrane receptor protein involved in Fe transport
MNRTYPIPNLGTHVRCFAALVVGALALSTQMRGQASQPTPVASSPSAGAGESSVVVLNPFEVAADKDNSYGALNSNSITRFNTELSKMPVTADIFNQAFIRDTGSTTVEAMIQNFSGAAGISAVDAANVGSQPLDHVAHNYLKINGFNTAAMQRDSLMPVGPLFNPGSTAPGITNNFDVERVEVIMGPQALLYSGGGPGGVVNIVSKQARFNSAPSGFLQFQVDQYGTKDAQFDYDQGNDRIAVRVAVLDDDDQTRRINIGDKVKGAYVQIAAKVFGNTTARLNLEQTSEHAFLGDPGMALASVAGDSRASDSLSYLLYTNQLGANTLNATTGAPNTAGAILGGTIDWSNVDSLAGWLGYEFTKTTTESLNIQTVWSANLSSELAIGYSDSTYGFRSGPASLYAPTNTSNPTGTWATGASPSETDEPAHTKAIRFSVVDTAELFNGSAESHTILGADFVGSRAYSIAYSYWLADANFNPVYAPIILNSTGTTNNNGRTKLPTQYYSLPNSFVTYPFFPLGATRVTFGGLNYVRMPTNQRNPALVSPANPLGTSSASGLNEYNIVNNSGYFINNMTQWLDKKLTTMAGVRLNNGFDSLIYVPPLAYRVASSPHAVDFDVGANYQLLPWLAPYFNASDVTTLPSGMFPDPAGNLPKPGKGVGEEVGLKFENQDKTVSGSLSYYHSHGTNELFSSSALEDAISPNGLNGRGNASTYFPLDHTTNGVVLDLTANPVSNWRMRLSAGYEQGNLTNSGAYAPLYNDQFYANTQGQVTYSDGTLVYINPTKFNTKAPVVTSTTAGAVPLTIAMMNNPANIYYANPTNPSGAINSSSTVATVLKVTDPVHGPILTGAVGLPISDIQITPSFGVPTSIQAFKRGDRSLGTPLFHVSYTNLYTFDHGLLKGLEVGGTVNAAYDTVGYYYLPNGFNTAAPARLAFHTPNSITLDPIVGYSRRFGKFTFQTQLNITNLFNHYNVVLSPSQTTGFGVIANLNASYYGQPRYYQWTNTLSF